MNKKQFEQQTNKLKISRDKKEYLSQLLGALIIPLALYTFSGNNQSEWGLTVIIAFAAVWIVVKMMVLKTQSVIYGRETFIKYHPTSSCRSRKDNSSNKSK